MDKKKTNEIIDTDKKKISEIVDTDKKKISEIVGMDKKKISEIVDILENRFPNARCELNYQTPFELLVAVILSAQCTDKRVNAVTAELFKKYSSPQDFCRIEIGELERLLYPVGFYRNKAAAVKAAAEMVSTRFSGVVPNELDELTQIPGVGRKTANVILSEAFHKNAFAVDTHVLRTADRLGIDKSGDPVKVEKSVTGLLDENRLGRAHILFVFFGRYVCVAKKPKCGECPVDRYCEYLKNAE
ncbi:MAG: endonuclease III [Clostridiales bacterium]|jgi:endonuclease-3|nr:endonuclease III [Clostridiales bacterium]